MHCLEFYETVFGTHPFCHLSVLSAKIISWCAVVAGPVASFALFVDSCRRYYTTYMTAPLPYCAGGNIEES